MLTKGKWSREEKTQILAFVFAIERGEQSVYRASINAHLILNRKYTSCYDKIQLERRILRNARKSS